MLPPSQSTQQIQAVKPRPAGAPSRSLAKLGDAVHSQHNLMEWFSTDQHPLERLIAASPVPLETAP
jgi:hypothetical protein